MRKTNAQLTTYIKNEQSIGLHPICVGNFLVNIASLMDLFLKTLDSNSIGRVWFAGLQGSYERGGATETSDIDMGVILDELTAADTQIYDQMLDTLPYRDKICGFLSGKTELMNWEPSDLFQFFYDTKPIKGSLEALLILIDDTAVSRAIKIGACDIYHGCVHNMVYDRNDDILNGLYKSASFLIQAICFKQTGNYITCQRELLETVSEEKNHGKDISGSEERGSHSF